MSARVLSFFRPAPATSGDWSQQELAEFYRVEAASLQAGLRLSLERGLSDEGDPWLVFCREDGEVFLHFARTDGSYVIVSDMLGEPLVGPNFRDLLAELVARNPSVLPINRQTLGGSGGRSGAQILMHPAALLAAIVATTCLFSSMNEAVASELEGTRLSGERPPDDLISPYDVGATLRHQDHDIVEGDAARSRASELRELAVSTSVVMACIASFLHQSSNQADPSLLAKLMSTESLSTWSIASAEGERVATAEVTSRYHGADWAPRTEAQDARGESAVHPETKMWAGPSPSEATAILLSPPGASVITIAPSGPQVQAKGGAMDGAGPLHVIPLTSSGTVRLVAHHAGEGTNALAKRSESSSSAMTDTSSDSISGLGSSAPSTAASEAVHQGEPSSASSSVGKASASASVSGLSNTFGASASSALLPSPSSVAGPSSKFIAVDATDGESSSTATQTKSSSTALGTDMGSTNPTRLLSDAINIKGIQSPLQDLANLSAKTASLFLHTPIGDTLNVGPRDGSNGSSTSQDIILVAGAMPSTSQIASAVAKQGFVLQKIDPATTSASGAASVIKKMFGTDQSTILSGSGDHVSSNTTGTASNIQAGLTPKVSQAEVAHAATASDAITLVAEMSTMALQATSTSSKSELHTNIVDPTPVTPALDAATAVKQSSTATGPVTIVPSTPETALHIDIGNPTSVTPASNAAAAVQQGSAATEPETIVPTGAGPALHVDIGNPPLVNQASDAAAVPQQGSLAQGSGMIVPAAAGQALPSDIGKSPPVTVASDAPAAGQAAIGVSTSVGAGNETLVKAGFMLPEGATGKDLAGSTVASEVDHTTALHVVSALVSSTNTVTKAVSLSLATGAIPFDAVQLRIIDTFIDSKPNMKIVATDTTLDIHDLSVLDDLSIHAMTWDLDGGSSIKVVGITDVYSAG